MHLVTLHYEINNLLLFDGIDAIYGVTVDFAW